MIHRSIVRNGHPLMFWVMIVLLNIFTSGSCLSDEADPTVASPKLLEKISGSGLPTLPQESDLLDKDPALDLSIRGMVFSNSNRGTMLIASPGAESVIVPLRKTANSEQSKPFRLGSRTFRVIDFSAKHITLQDVDNSQIFSVKPKQSR